MKKITTILIIVLIVTSCKWIDQNEDVAADAKAAAAVKDSTMVNDKDENGCLASAGYVWSKVNKECVKGFSGIQLNPTDKQDNQDETLSAYVLFSEDASQAEVFLPKDTTSIVLTRAAEGKPWILKEWQLVPWKGYVLKKGAVTMFAGDGEIGKKEIETDTEQ
ncbi:hypothetical protein [Flavobacterium sangjuense]|uniref:Lipoprotein n=1 Tax=Flavobacterium sangjuense TaxID=2518177 RepID=A0A4P7PV99_9FLAO|nr:hypothetical protein [Flavobacterium sangjuense]QBZ98290.1 hypothetical protein GS03_01795 [Flavobacterium sangjuense]